MEQTCVTCGDVKPEEEFSIRNKATGKRRGHCKVCEAAVKNKYYQANREKEIAGAKERKEELKVRNHNFLYQYLLDHPCACGENDPAALDFDHDNADDKEYNIARMANSHSIEAIEKELAKCTVMCANCHRKRTAKQFGWYKRVRIETFMQ